MMNIAIEQADVADAVHDERLLRRGGVGGHVEPERDEQVRREADALPAEEQRQVAVTEHQHQHRRDEQVEVAEEQPAPRVVGHVAQRVDVDEQADAGDEQHERGRQRVEQQAEVDLQLLTGTQDHSRTVAVRSSSPSSAEKAASP
jgi:hypothetical protein